MRTRLDAKLEPWRKIITDCRTSQSIQHANKAKVKIMTTISAMWLLFHEDETKSWTALDVYGYGSNVDYNNTGEMTKEIEIH